MKRRTFLGRCLAALGLGAAAAAAERVRLEEAMREYMAGLRRYLTLNSLTLEVWV